MNQCGLKEQERAEILLAAGAGSASLNASAASHLLVCVSCSEAFVEQAALWTRLDSWVVPEVSTSFNRELYAKIDAAISEPWYDRWAAQLKSMFTQPALAIGTAALVVVAGFMLDHSAVKPELKNSPRISSVYAPSVAVSASEAEQVEKTLDDLEMLRQFDLNLEEKDTTSKSM